ncbi:hypothetical protein, partial [Burkholderia thailandensis]|uniref:hypothetical protein n=1 Tax=Burkholderia thailandensis TaxID=57975 RepID=UPI0012FD18C8
ARPAAVCNGVSPHAPASDARTAKRPIAPRTPAPKSRFRTNTAIARAFAPRGRRLRAFYTPARTFDLPFTRDPLTFHRSDLEHGETKMDAVYIGGLALFTGLIVALIAGCEKLAQYGRGGRS